VERILRLENKCSIRREQHLDPSEDLIEIIDIRHGIVGDDRARRTFLGAYGDRDRKGEEFAERWNAVARRFRGDLLRRIDALDPHALATEERQQGSIIAAEFHHEIPGIQRETGRYRV